MKERLQKYLARCGVASRRKCEELIASGAVEVDGVLVTEPGTSVDPGVQVVKLHGERVKVASLVYYAVHKPRGVVCTHRDPSGRPRVVDLVPSRGVHLFPIGRLDEDSEGLLLLTNDGELAQRVAHPRFEVPKVYEVAVKGAPDPQALEKLRRGIWLSEGKTAPMRIAVLKKTRVLTTLLVTLREGRNRHIRRALALVQLPVRRLRRIRIGPVRLGSLKRGGWRRLTPAEVAALRQDPAALPVKKHPKRRKSAPSGRRRGGAAGARRKRERP